VRALYICRVDRSLLVGLGMVLVMVRGVCLGNLFVYCFRKNGEVETGRWRNNVLVERYEME
jgi:hypothetical protein